MELCSESKRERTVDLVAQIDLGLTIGSQVIVYATLIIVTMILFIGRTKQQRPCFVTLQVSLLWLSQFCFTSYDILIAAQKDSVDQQTALQNIIPTVGDLLFMIHDWLFTESFVSAALYLPITLDGLSSTLTTSSTNYSDTTSQLSQTPGREKHAKRIRISLNAFQYSMITLWFILSLKLGSLIIRMSLWTV